MEQKRVSFKVAKALKEANYPQEGDCWYSKDGKLSYWLMPHQQELYAPTYLEVWLWLWREKNIKIDIDYNVQTSTIYINNTSYRGFTFINPEEAIIAAIEYLVDNNLIK